MTLSSAVSKLHRTDSSHWLSHLRYQYLNWTKRIVPVLTDCLTCGIWTGQKGQFQFLLTLTCGIWTGWNGEFHFFLSETLVVSELNRTEWIVSVLSDFLTCGILTGQNRYFQFSLTVSPTVCELLTLPPVVSELDRTDTSSSHWLSAVVSEPDRTDTSSSHWLSHLRYLNRTERIVLNDPLTCGSLGSLFLSLDRWTLDGLESELSRDSSRFIWLALVFSVELVFSVAPSAPGGFSVLVPSEAGAGAASEICQRNVALSLFASPTHRFSKQKKKSLLRMYLLWSLRTLYLHACQVRVTTSDSGLCCCTRVMYFGC